MYACERSPRATIRTSHALEEGPDLGARWRLRGSTPSPEQWVRALWQDVLAQYLVCATEDARSLGVVLAYRPNFQDQHAYLAAARFDQTRHTPLMMLGVGMFINYVFTCWPFRKLYLETPEFNYDQFASGEGRMFSIEARLKDHSYFAGRHWDQLTLAIYRDQWARYGRRVEELEAPGEPRRVTIRIPAERKREP